MNRNAKAIVRFCFISAFVLIIVIYSFFQAYKLIAGPQITIYSPQNGSSYNSPLIEINGNAQNISSISLDDRSIFISTKGDFKEKLLLLPGYNIIVIKASDRFGKKTEKRLELILKEF